MHLLVLPLLNLRMNIFVTEESHIAFLDINAQVVFPSQISRIVNRLVFDFLRPVFHSPCLPILINLRRTIIAW